MARLPVYLDGRLVARRKGPHELRRIELREEVNAWKSLVSSNRRPAIAETGKAGYPDVCLIEVRNNSQH